MTQIVTGSHAGSQPLRTALRTAPFLTLANRCEPLANHMRTVANQRPHCLCEPSFPGFYKKPRKTVRIARTVPPAGIISLQIQITAAGHRCVGGAVHVAARKRALGLCSLGPGARLFPLHLEPNPADLTGGVVVVNASTRAGRGSVGRGPLTQFPSSAPSRRASGWASSSALEI